ncbi:MAG: hypothetical protein V2A72_04400 [Candidatus Omnitrophota bacterium]
MKTKDLLLPKIVFEAKYKQGYRYLDRCGETMIEVENKLKNWNAKEANISSGQMQNISENMIFNFSSLKLDLNQNNVKDLDCTNFFTYSKEIFKIVSKNLGIKDYIRFGLRYWLLYPIDSVKTGRRILSTNGFFKIDNKIEKMFDKEIKDRNFIAVLEKDKEGHRISLAMVFKEGTNIEKEENKFLTTAPHKLPTKQKEALIAQLERKQKQAENPDVALLIDIDSYINDPKTEQLDGFIKSAADVTIKNAISLIEEK